MLNASLCYETVILSLIMVLNNTNYNFLDCDWFKKLLFSTINSLAKLLSDSLLSDKLLSDSLLSDNLLSDSLKMI